MLKYIRKKKQKQKKQFQVNNNLFNNKREGEVLIYQCKGLLPSTSGTSGSAFHFETM
jgi:hypothetical protein